MFAKILVLARGNDPQQPAVERAASCAGRTTQLAILDVVHEPALDGYMGNTTLYEPLRARVVAERKESVKGLVTALRARGLDATGDAVWDHSLDEAIARRVRAQNASIVMIAPVEAPAGGLSLGDWRVVSTCPAPVLVVKRAPGRKYRYIVAAVDPFHAHAKPADLDLAILARAQALQAQTGAQLSVIHCHAAVEFFGAAVATSAAGAQDDGRREALEELVRKSGVSAAVVQVVAGAPHAVLKRMAERGEADAIVMGALARGRLKDWLIGSTAERVLHGVQADVLAVKPEHVS